ncbi:unnamed protein product, partial [Adineta steineri]
MVLKIQSKKKSTNNRQLGQYREETALKFVHYISDVGSNAIEESMNDQGFHDNTENGDEQLSDE